MTLVHINVKDLSELMDPKVCMSSTERSVQKWLTAELYTMMPFILAHAKSYATLKSSLHHGMVQNLNGAHHRNA